MSGLNAWVTRSAVAIAVLCTASVSWAQNSISVGSVNTVPGATGIVVPISVTNSQQLTVLNVDITFDVALCGMIQNQALMAGPHADANDGPQEGGIKCPSEGKISAVFFDLGGGSAVPVGSGVIVNWSFDVLAGAAGGTFPLTITVVQSSNGPTTVPLSVTNGQLLIAAPPTSTPTRSATASQTATFTSTAILPTSTPTLTVPPASTSTATQTQTQTAANTATATRTNTPENTATQTNTAPASTATPEDTATQEAASTATATSTTVPVDTNTPVNTSTATNTAPPTSTGTVTATRTITNTPNATSTRPPIPVVASPTSPAGLLMISALSVALFFAVRRLGRR